MDAYMNAKEHNISMSQMTVQASDLRSLALGQEYDIDKSF